MLAATAAILIPVSAMAQTARDVVVMRRVIAPPQVDRDAQGYDQNTFHWETGPWTNNPSCSATAVQTRLVGCVKHREQQPDASCGTPKPDTQRTVADYSTCGFSWQVTGHGAWSSTCSANATRTTT